MISPSTLAALGEFHEMMKRAQERCEFIAGSEKFLGYDDSARDYRDMAKEFQGLANWLSVEVNGRR